MDDDAKRSVETELFNEQALLILMDGNREDANALLSAAVAELGDTLEKLRQHINNRNFGGIMLDGINARGLAIAMTSRTLEDAADRVVRMAFIRNFEEARMSFRDLRDCMTQVELHLRLKGWL